MTKVSVVVYGKELQIPIDTSYEISVFGKSNVIIFINSECVNLLSFDEKSISDYKTVLFTGKDIQTVLKAPETIVFVGNVDKITFVNNKGDVTHTYKVNDCDAKEAFSEIS
jgi:hypothetical protein